MKWIDPKNKMPKNDKDVLVYMDTKTYNQPFMAIGYFCGTEKMWWSSEYGSLEDYGFWVSHWMELPDKP